LQTGVVVFASSLQLWLEKSYNHQLLSTKYTVTSYLPCRHGDITLHVFSKDPHCVSDVTTVMVKSRTTCWY